MYFAELLFSPCLANVLIRRNYFVTSVLNLPQCQQRKSFSPIAKKAYELYFGRKFVDQDRSWAPHSCCSNVRDTDVAVLLALTNQRLQQSLLFEENTRIILPLSIYITESKKVKLSRYRPGVAQRVSGS
jgi:hypothetical protein